jgi:DNA mismatch repair ATPase MutS
MKAFLMYRDRDVDLEADLPSTAAAMIQDLELNTLFGAMAAGDRFLFDMARKAVLTSLEEPAAIRYRQQILADGLEQPAVIRELYALAVEAIDREKRIWGGLLNRYPESALHRSVDVLELFVELLKRLRRIAEEHAAAVHSEGLTRFFAMVAQELDDAYLQMVEDHLERLRFRDGLVMSADIGPANRGTHHVLRKRVGKRTWKDWIGLPDRPGYVYQIPDRDQAGSDALTELKGRGLSQAAGALAQSTDHILDFFQMLRAELGFYVGCLNLRDTLAGKGEPTCFPRPTPAGVAVLTGRGLYDVCLSLTIRERVVGNETAGDGKALVMITGANRGGKSTLLRGLGLAQLMMQCGMFVAAESFRADVRSGMFTHFKREEDASLRSGKLDEELGRMSALVDRVTPDSLVILNESFASTNEREGSEIARQIVRALLESGVKVFYVTHLYDLAQGFHREGRADMLFLRAERESDGHRTFQLIEREPLPTSYGEDVYRRIFQAGGESVVAT